MIYSGILEMKKVSQDCIYYGIERKIWNINNNTNEQSYDRRLWNKLYLNKRWGYRIKAGFFNVIIQDIAVHGTND